MDPITESIDQHVESNHDALTLVSGDGPAIPGTSAFCVVYAGGRPVLQWVKAVLFFKPKWKAFISAIIAGLDAVCAEKPAGTQVNVADNGGNELPSHNGAAVDQKDESLQGD